MAIEITIRLRFLAELTEEEITDFFVAVHELAHDRHGETVLSGKSDRWEPDPEDYARIWEKAALRACARKLDKEIVADGDGS